MLVNSWDNLKITKDTSLIQDNLNYNKEARRLNIHSKRYTITKGSIVEYFFVRNQANSLASVKVSSFFLMLILKFFYLASNLKEDRPVSKSLRIKKKRKLVLLWLEKSLNSKRY